MLEFLSALGALVATYAIVSIIRTEIADRRDHKRYISKLRQLNKGYYGEEARSVRERREAGSPLQNPFGNIR